MNESQINEKKRLDDVFDERVKTLVDEQLMKRIPGLLTQLESIMSKDRVTTLQTVDEELNRSYVQISENFKWLNSQISSTDMECATLTKALIDKGVITTEEMTVKFQELNSKIKDTVRQTYRNSLLPSERTNVPLGTDSPTT
jgi:septal ring factor EnvC (AmiA/AmiB activator)